MQLQPRRYIPKPILGISYNPLLAKRSVNNSPNKKDSKKKDPLRPGSVIGPSGF